MTKVYVMGATEVHALSGVSLTIHEGEYVAIIGASGSGKSTLMNMIGLLDRPTSGSYRIRGTESSQLSKNRMADLRSQEIGFVFQRFNLLARTTAQRQVELPLFYAGVPSRKAATHGRRRTDPGWAGRSHPAPARRAVRRPAAARGDRACAGQPPEHLVGRRADRGPRFQNRRRIAVALRRAESSRASPWSSSPTIWAWPTGRDGSSRCATARSSRTLPIHTMCRPHNRAHMPRSHTPTETTQLNRRRQSLRRC